MSGKLQAPDAAVVNVLPPQATTLEDRFALGERIEVRPRPIEIGLRGRIYEFLVPTMMPMAVACLAVVLVTIVAAFVATVQSGWMGFAFGSLAVGYVAGIVGSRILVRNYRRSLSDRPQPSAIVDSSGIELDLPPAGRQRFDWADVTGLAQHRMSRTQDRIELLGRGGRVLAVIPWGLVLAKGNYQLSEYIVAAAPNRFAIDPVKAFLPGYGNPVLGRVKLAAPPK